METTSKALREIALTDLILPAAALDNIVEDNELNEKLDKYAIKATVDSKIEELNNKIETEYTGIELYNNLTAQIQTINDRLDEFQSLSSRVASLEEAIEIKPPFPDEPTEPTEPENPDEPTDPENPDEPTKPDEPTEPENPGTDIPDNSNNQNQNSENTQSTIVASKRKRRSSSN